MKTVRIDVETALNRKYPEWVFFLLTIDLDGRANIMPAGWAMICSFQPRMIAIAVDASNYSAKLIEAAGQFVVAFAGPQHADRIEPAGQRSGRNTDKFAALGLEHTPAAVVDVPILTDSPLQFECQVASSMPAGDHIIVAAHVVAAHVCDPPIPKLENFHRLYRPAKPDDCGLQDS